MEALALSTKKIKLLKEEDKERLRSVVRKNEQQTHWCDQAASGADRSGPPTSLNNREAHARSIAKHRFVGQLLGHANPLPTPQEYIVGLDHKNDREENVGVKFYVIKALHSRKIHYYTKLKTRMGDIHAREPWRFPDCYPDTLPVSGGFFPLTEQTWEALRETFNH